jgi:hypothetical protein
MTPEEEAKADAAEREKFKKEVIREIRRGERRRRMFSCFGCLTIQIAIILIPVAWAATVIARSGLAEVPMLTSRLYKPAEPSRVVTPIAGSNAEQIMSAAAARAKYNAGTGAVTLELKETELTAMVNSALAGQQEQLPIPVKSAQTAVMPEGLELFLVLPRDDRDVGVRLLLGLAVSDQGELEVTLKEGQIGGQTLPEAFGQLVSSVLGPVLGDALTSGMGEAGKITAIETREGVLAISVVPSR